MNGNDSKYWEEKTEGIKEDIRGINKRLDVMSNKMICNTHTERINNIKDSMKVVWGMLMLLFSGIVGGFWWTLRK